MTINKAQSQTFKLMGTDLRSDCFIHGQLLYVGLPKMRNSDIQYILLPDNQNVTINIIYPEVL